jgi:hypothetical protein
LFLGFNALNASSDILVTGGYSQRNNANQAMSAGKTQMQIGATDRAHANYINARSDAGRSHSNTGNGGGSDFQWGSSQTENIWKAWRTFEDAGNVTGLVVGDCRGDNSSNAYRARRNQSRKGFISEPLVSQTQYQENHTTNK